jgi:putative membrane protein
MSARAKNTNFKLILTVAAAVTAVALMAAAGMVMAADTGLTPVDRDFINQAAQGGMMEVAAGKLAAQRAMDPTVKAFGRKMVTDHSAANDMLKSLAASKNVPLPESVSEEEHAALGKLEGLNGTEFDKTYSQMMVKDHVTDVGDFEKEVQKAKDPDVKSFAEQTLPTLRHHLMMANQLSAAQKKSP